MQNYFDFDVLLCSDVTVSGVVSMKVDACVFVLAECITIQNVNVI